MNPRRKRPRASLMSRTVAGRVHRRDAATKNADHSINHQQSAITYSRAPSARSGEHTRLGCGAGRPARHRSVSRAFGRSTPGAEAVVYESHRLTSYSPHVRPSAPFAGRASELLEKPFSSVTTKRLALGGWPRSVRPLARSHEPVPRAGISLRLERFARGLDRLGCLGESLTSGKTRKHRTLRLPCFTSTHSPCRGDFSSFSLPNPAPRAGTEKDQSGD